MLIEVYQMTAAENTVSITLEAVCDAFSSFLWDIEYFQCGQFELYIAATPETVAVFQTGRLVGRKDDTEHYGLMSILQIRETKSLILCVSLSMQWEMDRAVSAPIWTECTVMRDF